MVFFDTKCSILYIVNYKVSTAHTYRDKYTRHQSPHTSPLSSTSTPNCNFSNYRLVNKISWMRRRNYYTSRTSWDNALPRHREPWHISCLCSWQPTYMFCCSFCSVRTEGSNLGNPHYCHHRYRQA